ncbi:BamA/TamA family outer membrane protein [Parapedobacter deserti]|uniref:BamA/TamA family outer membrane protein n=1 Tax=Parapedobacter deserti TaxID=1912957 RepID=A0ABV7JK94_9SPHI
MPILHAAFSYTHFIFLLICLSFSITTRAQHIPNRHATAPLAVNSGRAVQYVDGQLTVSTIFANEKAIAITTPHRVVPYFCSISDDGHWLLYSVKTKQEKITYVHDLTRNGEMKQRYPFAIESVAFTGDGNKAFIVHSKSFWGSKLAAYDTQHWQLLAERSITDLTTSIAVNADGSQLLAAARSVVRVIDTETLETEKVHWETSRLHGVVYSPTDLHQYASISHKNRIEVRDLSVDRVVHTIHADQGQVTQLAYAPDGRHLMSIDGAGHLDIWDLQEYSRVMALENITAADGLEEGKLTVLSQAGWQSAKTDFTGVPVGAPPARPESAFLNGPTSKVGIVPIPIISYSPETSFLLGLGMSFIFPPKDNGSSAPSRFFRPSSITPSIAYGFNGQLQTNLTVDYFSKSGWHFFNQASFLHNNRSYFFGLGNGAQKQHSTVYHNNVFSWEGEVTKAIGHRLFAGITYQVRNDSRLDFDELAALPVPDKRGGFLAGAGPVLRFDTRNDLFFPTGGYYADLSFKRYGGWLGSDYGYSDLKLDYRGFHALPILTEGTTLAVQALYHGIWTGDAPFYQLPYLSADRLLRGIWRNLYIDKQAVALQGELRSNFSNVDPRYGYVVFAGAGDVAPNFFEDYQPGITGVFGVGFRQQVIPKLKLQSRIDLSVTTKGNVGVFGGVGLTF